MFKNYFKIAFRNILKHKAFSLINMLGLSIGIAICLLIVQYVSFELSYDHFHKNIEQLYRITTQYPSGDQMLEDAASHNLAGPMMKEEFPEVLDYARFYMIENCVLGYEAKRFNENKIFVASPSFLTMFSWEFLQGDPFKALDEPLSIVLTESAAKRYFGNQDPMGRVLIYKDNQDEEQMTVTGVIQDVPANSHIHFDALVSYATAVESWNYELTWSHNDDYTYLQLAPHTHAEDLQTKFSGFKKKYMPEHDKTEYVIQPVADIHLYSHKTYEVEANGNANTVYALLIVAFLVIVIAWVNYVNLATVQSLGRAKETGIRKVIGASRYQLIRQFLLETCLLNGISFLLALVLVVLVAPYFQQLVGKPLTLEIFSQLDLWLLASIILAAGILLSSFYPAFVLSGFMPLKVLKGSYKASERGIKFRKVLVLTQFTMTMLLLAGTFAVYQQINFIKKQELGADIEQTLVVHAPGFAGSDSVYHQNLAFFKNEITLSPTVSSITISQAMPGNGIFEMSSTDGFYQPGKKPDVPLQYYFYGVDEDYVTTLDLTLLAGTTFQTNEQQYSSMIINEKAMQQLGFENPEEAVQSQVMLWDKTYTVVGVVANYHFLSLKEAHVPMILLPSHPYFANYYAIKLDVMGNDSYQDVIADIRQAWFEAFPNSVFDYYFLDEKFDAQYRSDVQFGQVFGLFSGLAIFIACLGLLGLASFTAKQRTKEIGIRKVLGASVKNILLLLSKDYMKLILIAFFIAIPVANYIISEWLQNFAYRIEISWWLFAIPGVMILLIAAFSVSSQTLKAARKNPVDSLRFE